MSLFIFFPPNSLTLPLLVHAEVLSESRVNAIWSQPSTNGPVDQWTNALAFCPSENRKTKDRFNFFPWKYYKTVKKMYTKGNITSIYPQAGGKDILFTWKLVACYILPGRMVPRDKIDGYNFLIQFSAQQEKWYLFFSFFFKRRQK